MWQEPPAWLNDLLIRPKDKSCNPNCCQFELKIQVLGTCLSFPEQHCQESQVDELQDGVEVSFAVPTQPSVLVQLSETALGDPAFVHGLEGVHFTGPVDLQPPWCPLPAST